MVDKAIFLFPEHGSIGQGFRCDLVNGAKPFNDFSFSRTSLSNALSKSVTSRFIVCCCHFLEVLREYNRNLTVIVSV